MSSGQVNAVGAVGPGPRTWWLWLIVSEWSRGKRSRRDGTRPWKGLPQPADDRVDRIEATKRLPNAGETPGATIDVWIINPD
jgi:hypothetical protein